jgi:predicted CXXCH cytochrome family protein
MESGLRGAPRLPARWRAGAALPALVVVAAATAVEPVWVDARCGGCHRIEERFSHPVGVVPAGGVPDDLPLEGGRIECATCHDNRLSADHALARQTHEPLLRRPAVELCIACHETTGAGRRDAHAMALSRAHLRWPDDARRRGSSGLAGGPLSPDPQSHICLGCHDGAVARDASDVRGIFAAATKRSRGPAPIDASHPVGVEYGPRTGLALKPASMLDGRIRLFDNQIGCGTCHSLYAGSEGLLVMSNQKSRLCLSCHDF